MNKIKLQRDVFKLVANDRSDKRFLLTSNFVPWGCLPLTCSYIHLLNHEKMCIKSEVEEIARNTPKRLPFSHLFHNISNKYVKILACDIICILRNVSISGTDIRT